eukprot:SAG22_NODE_40_length_25739_cov_38.630031_3_plen_97_part_00
MSRTFEGLRWRFCSSLCFLFKEFHLGPRAGPWSLVLLLGGLLLLRFPFLLTATSLAVPVLKRARWLRVAILKKLFGVKTRAGESAQADRKRQSEAA